MTRHRVAIVGAGIGSSHLVGYVQNPRLYEVATICDLNRARAESLVSLVPTARSTAEFARVLDDPTIDVVSVCTPPYLHRDLALQVLEAGKHVVVEKPVAASPADVDQLAAAAVKADRLLLPVFQYRYSKGPRQLRRLIAEGLAGPPIAASLVVHWDRDAAYYSVPWRGKLATELGGVVIGHLIHAHDLLTYLTEPVARVRAEVATLVHPLEVEDTAAITMRLSNGALATSAVTIGAAGNYSGYRFVYAGVTVESGSEPYSPGEDTWKFTARDPGLQAEVDDLVHEEATPRRNGFAGLFEDFGAALAGTAPPPVTVAEAHAAISLVAAIYHSAESGTTVDLPLPPNHKAYSRTP